ETRGLLTCLEFRPHQREWIPLQSSSCGSFLRHFRVLLFCLSKADWIASDCNHFNSPLVTASCFFILRLQLLYHRSIGQGCRIAQRPPFGNVTQQSPHNLSAASLRQFRREEDGIRPGNRADLLRNVLLQFGHLVRISRCTLLQGDKGSNSLSFNIVFLADHGGFGDLMMMHKGAFDLHGADPMACDVHNIIHASQQPEITLGVALTAISGKINILAKTTPVGLNVTLWIAVDRARHRRPGRFEHEVTSTAERYGLAGLVYNISINAGQWKSCRTRFGGSEPRKWRNQNRPGLRLPPGINDGALPLSDHFVIPHPGLGIDGLSHRP